MKKYFLIPFLTSVLILSIGLTQEASAVPVTGCEVLNTPDTTFVLANDIATSGTCFTISGENITFDGNGFTLSGDDTGFGIRVNAAGVTIKNTIIEEFAQGIFLGSSASQTTVTGNTMSSNSENGIQVQASSDNLIEDNTFVDNSIRGIILQFDSNQNTVVSNNISGSLHGIHLSGGALVGASNNMISDNYATMNNEGVLIQSNSNGNTIIRNTFESNIEFGVFIGASDDNLVYNNNFIDNPFLAKIGSGSGNVFNLPAPFGGNFWDSYNEPLEGCDDADADNFCDAPLLFSGGQDSLPWTIQNGWLSPSAQVTGFINQIQSLDLAENITTSLVGPLNQAVDLLEDDVPQNDKAVCGKLNAFLNEVDAKEGNGQLSPDQASDLRDQATSIQNILGC